MYDKLCENMRNGFTTGSCAAAAAKAASYMLLTGKIKNSIGIVTPKGVTFETGITDIKREDKKVSCSVVKDGGDDPDITTGTHINACVSLIDDGIIIDGGKGVGRVTKPGLDQEIGCAAINHVPREMIKAAVEEVMSLCDYTGGLSIIISVPEGEEIAKKTFNSKLGIIGGISIIGTSGIVEPMSTQAIKDTIMVELRQRKALGEKMIIMSPGNYGVDFSKATYGIDLDKSVKCSNYVGDAIEMASELGFEKLLLIGHIGKLIKVSGGIMNTHSKEADCRLELIASAAYHYMSDKNTISDADKLSIIGDILNAVTTESACEVLKRNEILEGTMKVVMDKIMMHLEKRTEKMQIECIIFSMDHGLLCESFGARSFLERIKE